MQSFWMLLTLGVGVVSGKHHGRLHGHHNTSDCTFTRTITVTACPTSLFNVSSVSTVASASNLTSFTNCTTPSSPTTATTPSQIVSLTLASSKSHVLSSTPSARTSKSSVSTAAPSAVSTPSKSKRGLAFTNVDLVKPWAGKDIGWAYNWWTGRGDLPPQFEYMPMMWCPTKLSVSSWLSAARKAIGGGSKHILGFNEPDQPKQCHIAVEDAVAGHKSHMNPLKGEALIGSPCITSNPAPKGISYLTAFLEGCAGDCAIDFLCTHWYGTPGNEVWNFQHQVNRTIELGKQHNISQVYVTEFGLTGATEEQRESFLKSVLPWLDENESVGGYAYFMVSNGILMDEGSLSSLGKVYAEA